MWHQCKLSKQFHSGSVLISSSVSSYRSELIKQCMKDKFANMLFPRLRRLKHCRVAILPRQPAIRGLTMIGSIWQPIRKEEQPDGVVVWMSEILLHDSRTPTDL